MSGTLHVPVSWGELFERAPDAEGSFDAEFGELTRGVYQNNDERSRIKRAINETLRSAIIEEKQYVRYGNPA